ncbi:MAG: SemiSWEET family sugar transporter [Daejeonella sp.]
MEKEIIGMVAGILTAASLIPQFIKSVKDKKVEVSPLMFLILIGGNGLWIWYGIKLEALPIIITNAFSLLMDIIMLFLSFWYGKKKK